MRNLAALGALALLHVVFFFGNLFGTRTFFYDDFWRHQLPLWTLVTGAIREHRLPLWNRYLWFGGPLAANPAAQTFYPTTWLLARGDALHTLNFGVVLHLFVGGAWTYALARRRGATEPAAFCGAVAFSFGGIALSYTSNPFYLFSLAWLPAVILAFDCALAGSVVKYAALGSVAFALLVLGGDPQQALMAGLILALIGGAHVLASADRVRTLGRAAAAGGIICGLGLALAAVQVLPTWEASHRTERAFGVGAEAAWFSLHPARLVTWLAPHFFGVTLPENSFWGSALGGGMRFWFPTVYLGALILCAIVCVRRDPFVIGAGAASVVLLALAMIGARSGSLFRYSEKWAAPLAVILPVLGALGLSRALEQRRRLAIALGGAAALGVACLVGHSAFARFAPIPQLAPAAAHRVLIDGIVLLIVCAAALLALRWKQGLALCAIAAADVVFVGHGAIWTAPADVLSARPALVDRPLHPGDRVLRSTALDQMLVHRNLDGYLRGLRQFRQLLAPEDPARFGVTMLPGYGAFRPAEVPLLFRNLAKDDFIQLAAHLSVDWRMEPDHLERLPDAAPRVRLTGAQVVPGSLLQSRAFAQKPLGAAIIDADEALFEGTVQPPQLAGLPKEGSGSATIEQVASEQVVVRTSSPADAVLVLAEQYFPGWRAEIDGHETGIFRADLLGRGVHVPAGDHRVRFWFEVPSVALGARVSLSALATLVLLVVISRRKIRR
jgi:hypothetical protein